jgi:hypothetical protein
MLCEEMTKALYVGLMLVEREKFPRSLVSWLSLEVPACVQAVLAVSTLALRCRRDSGIGMVKSGGAGLNLRGFQPHRYTHRTTSAIPPATTPTTDRRL